MRLSPLAVLLLVPLAALTAATPELRPATINHRVSARDVALNEPVRVEFVTMPRQVEGVDIAVAVGQDLEGARAVWRVLAPPAIAEHEKTKTLTISFSVLAREPGEHDLPLVRIPWLHGGITAGFGGVKVRPVLRAGSVEKELPKEIHGVAGYPWGVALSEARARVPADAVAVEGDRTIVRPSKNLELIFRDGVLAEAALLTPTLALPQAREAFLDRWGTPQLDGMLAGKSDPGLLWVVGWTEVAARPWSPQAGGAASGIRITITRADISAKLDQRVIERQVFDVLEGGGAAKPAPATPEQQAADRKDKAADELKRPRIPTPEGEAEKEKAAAK